MMKREAVSPAQEEAEEGEDVQQAEQEVAGEVEDAVEECREVKLGRTQVMEAVVDQDDLEEV